MHGLRVPATGKTTRYPPSFELVTSFLVLMVPPCRFFPASHSPCICFTSTFIKKKHKINPPGIWERDIFRVSLFACLIRNTKMYRKKMRERTTMIVKTNVQAVGRRHKEKGETWVAAKSSVARFYRRGTQGVSFLFCRCWDPQAVHLFQDFSHEKNVKKSEKKA